MITMNINPKKLIFNSKATLACKSCKHYGFKATCPPYVESMEYFKKVLTSYRSGRICYDKFETDYKNWQEMGKQSSLKIHKYLLMRRKELIERGNYFHIILGAGSCKLCDDCSVPCKNPANSIIPVEGTGIDVVATLKQYNIDIKFPIKENFYRIGMILYD